MYLFYETFFLIKSFLLKYLFPTYINIYLIAEEWSWYVFYFSDYI